MKRLIRDFVKYAFEMSHSNSSILRNFYPNDLLLAANVKSQGVFNWASFVNIEQKYIVWWKQMTVSTSSSDDLLQHEMRM